MYVQYWSSSFRLPQNLSVVREEQLLCLLADKFLLTAKANGASSFM